MIKELKEAGIATGIHYPIPLHRQRAYESMGYKLGDFPVTEKIASQIVSLPMFPNLTAEQIQFRALNGEDPLRQFSDTCRTEIESMQKQL